ncbi:hypothetical protein NDU88_005005 [Pleurodeles waltl]|uniref:Uncharacterized protein n=1 Tax=Pleurodeles waltl TaxID=8319 RepID=A0AAV7M8P4_PLEWA|nr:hypothetical protein NDU88_005005 [Pleurodeles waltl]
MRADALTDSVFMQIVDESVDHSFEENWESAANCATEWDAMKVVLKGDCMKMTYDIKMQLMRMTDVHEGNLKKLEEEIMGSPQKAGEWKTTNRELLDMWDSLDKFVHAAHTQHIYEGGDWASRMLTRLISNKARGQQIAGVEDVQGQMVTLQQGISEVFAAHLRKDYTQLCALSLTSLTCRLADGLFTSRIQEFFGCATHQGGDYGCDLHFS